MFRLEYRLLFVYEIIELKWQKSFEWLDLNKFVNLLKKIFNEQKKSVSVYDKQKKGNMFSFENLVFQFMLFVNSCRKKKRKQNYVISNIIMPQSIIFQGFLWVNFLQYIEYSTRNSFFNIYSNQF
jgi:hypothetical protein